MCKLSQQMSETHTETLNKLSRTATNNVTTQFENKTTGS